MTIQTGCMSCDLLSGKRTAPGGTVAENEFWHVDSVIAPVYWRGFLVLKLKRHCEHLAELTPDEAATLGPLIQSTSAAMMELLQPAKIYVMSMGDGVKHIHFWLLPRPRDMHPGMRTVSRHLNMRAILTRAGIKRWIVADAEVVRMADDLRAVIAAGNTAVGSSRSSGPLIVDRSV